MLTAEGAHVDCNSWLSKLCQRDLQAMIALARNRLDNTGPVCLCCALASYVCKSWVLSFMIKVESLAGLSLRMTNPANRFRPVVVPGMHDATQSCS